jgi:hypothetical protein
MLIKILQNRLTLGRTIYQRGDIFDCPPNEAQMMAAIGVGALAPATASATREPPLAPRGISMRGKVATSLPTRARRIGAVAATGE